MLDEQQEEVQEQQSNKTIFQIADEASEPTEDSLDEGQEAETHETEEAQQTQFSVEELTQKAETEDLTEEEIQFLEDQGYQYESAEGEGKKEEEEEEVDAPLYADLLSDEFPDKEYSSREEYEKDITEAYKKKADELKKELESTEMFRNKLAENPDWDAMFKAVTQGKSLRVAMIEAGMTPEDLEFMPEDEDYQQGIDAKVQLELKKKEREAEQIKVQQNIKESENNIIDWQKNNEVPDNLKAQVLQRANQINENILTGIITPDLLTMIYNHLTIDSKVENARNSGLREGKNQKITRVKKKLKGDGQPRLSGASKASRKISKKPQGDRMIQSMINDYGNKPKSLGAMLRKAK